MEEFEHMREENETNGELLKINKVLESGSVVVKASFSESEGSPLSPPWPG